MTSTTEPAASTGWRWFTEFSDECTGIGPPAADGQAQITFVHNGRLHAVTAETPGDEAPCLLDDATEPLLWGPDATKVLLGDRLVTSAGRSDATFADDASFTRPTGTSMVAVVDGRLVKTNVSSGGDTDISFLARHDDVTYYPSGTHVIAAGRDEGGTDGIWLATNNGTDPQLLAESPDTTFSHLAVSEDGTVLVFAADHGGEVHVHRTHLVGDVLITGDEERHADTLLTTPGPVVSVVLDAGGDVAIGHGTCTSTDGWTSLWPAVDFDDGSSDELTKGTDGWPIGFLPDGALVYGLRSRGGCFAPGEPFGVWLRQTEPDEPDILIAADVTAAAVRTAVGEPPPPPADNLSGFV